MYIRTKDGVYDTTKIATGSKYMNFATNDESFREIFKTEPLAKSENLEELCDCYVFEFENASRFVIDADEYCNYENHIRKNCYGAIWTDKGLIYVAKMNSEGKLVLI